MWVESEPGRGSSFYWTANFTPLPFEESAYPEKATNGNGQVRILVAEDHELSRTLLKKLLEMRDYHVAVVTNGKEVLEIMKHQVFDLVLMDIRMPEMDGLEATAEIRAREQAGRRIPIVAVTADAGAGLRKYYLAAGFNEYLSKPIQPESLYALIERLVYPKSDPATA
jgi:CheY-like chemotaxis protein